MFETFAGDSSIEQTDLGNTIKSHNLHLERKGAQSFRKRDWSFNNSRAEITDRTP